jgi:hypothetical protein
MASLDRAAILCAAVPFERVEVPEWGGAVCVRAVSVSALFEVLHGSNDPAERTARLVTRACCDDSGAPLFTADDEPALLALPGAGLLRVSAVALRINGLTADSQDALGKASAPTGDGASCSGSPGS